MLGVKLTLDKRKQWHNRTASTRMISGNVQALYKGRFMTDSKHRDGTAETRLFIRLNYPFSSCKIKAQSEVVL